MPQLGTSQKTGIYPATSCSDAIIPAAPSIPEGGSSSAQVRRSFSGRTQEMQFLFGGLPNIEATPRKGSSARCSVTRAHFGRQSLSDKLTQSLITAGLVAGTTPSLIRKQSGVAILDFVSLPLDGGAVDNLEKACSSSRGSHD